MVVNCSHLGRNFFYLRFTVFARSFSFSLEVSNTPGKPPQEVVSGMGMRGTRKVSQEQVKQKGISI